MFFLLGGRSLDSNHPQAASEDSLRLVSVHPLTLEECLEFIDDDELLEITPKSLRMRKRVLSHEERARAAHRAKG